MLYFLAYLIKDELIFILLRFSGVGKTDEFYAVANSIGNKDWNEFARKESCLGLAGSIIDNIKHDYPHSILEQKYQMLCKWEAKLGRESFTVFFCFL